jgi:hypothetical protein
MIYYNRKDYCVKWCLRCRLPYFENDCTKVFHSKCKIMKIPGGNW